MVRTLQRGLVLPQIGHQPLELGVLLLELLQPADLHHAHPGKLLFPAVARGLGHAELAADLRDGRAALGLPQRKAICSSVYRFCFVSIR